MFTQIDRDKIKEAITAAEKNTSGEIVPVAVPSSSFYAWTHWLWAFLGFVVASSIAIAWNQKGSWPLALPEVVLLQFSGAAFGFCLPVLHWFKRLTIPKHLKDYAVHEAAQAHFVNCGVHLTSERTGILIYLSLLERQVEILADKGIHDKLGDDFWHEQTAQIVAGIQAGNPVGGITQAIDAMGKKLAEHFPASPDHVNQLGNELRS